MNEPNILVVGSANTDMIVGVPHLPLPGETVLGGTFAQNGGGKGANQAVAAARAGGRVAFVARQGMDAFASVQIAQWTRDGLGLDHLVADSETPSGVALIFVDPRGENCIAVAPGANDRLSPEDVDAAGVAFRTARYLLLQLEVPLPTVIHAARRARAEGVRVILNPAPARALPEDLLRNVSILTPNRTEAAALAGFPVTDPGALLRAAHVLLDQGPEAVLITLGGEGVLVATRETRFQVPAFPVTPVDTVAAGDVFNGALASGLAEGQELPDAVRFASAAAALSVTRRGAQASAPHRAEIQAFLAAHPI